MPDSDTNPMFESPITSTYPANPAADLILRDVSVLSKVVVRADPDTAAAERMGVPFGAARVQDEVLIVGQRPTEWTLIGPALAVGTLVSAIDRTGHVSTIDHTHSRSLFQLSGADAPQMLEKVCALDWSDAMTPNGAVVSASVAKVTCDIVRKDRGATRAYLLATDRSFGQYLFDALLDGGLEFGIGAETLAGR